MYKKGVVGQVRKKDITERKGVVNWNKMGGGVRKKRDEEGEISEGKRKREKKERDWASGLK